MKFVIRMIIFLNIVIFSLGISYTYSHFSDEENIFSNIFSSSVLDLGLRENDENSESTHSVEIGGAEEFDIFLQKLGSADFVYKQNIRDVSEERLCSELNLKVWYYWYDSNGVSHDDLKYAGNLVDFEINEDGDDAALQIQNANDYFSNSYYANNEHWFHYQVSLPENYDGDLEEICTYNLIFTGWLKDYDTEEAYWDEEFLENSIVIKSE